MLRIGGYINILIAVGHIVGLMWADQMFAVTGIGKEMQELSQINASLPYLMTIFVAVIFFTFGLYGLSADNRYRKLPFSKPTIFIIAGIYIFRGLGELIFDTVSKTNSLAEITYSLFALTIGLLFLIGGLRKWKKRITNS